MLKRWSTTLVLLGALTAPPPLAGASEGATELSVPPPSATGREAAPQASLQLKERGKGNPSELDSINVKYLKGYFTDTGKIITSPLHWDSGDWLKAGLVVSVTSGLFFADQSVKNFAVSHRSAVADKFSSVGNALGDPVYAPSALAGLYLYGYLSDDHRAKRTALLSMESYAISSLFTSGLKNMVGRHRPNSGATPGTLDGPELNAKNLSFSSGHTSTAFSIATVIANEYKDTPFVPPLAYGLATLTGLSRIYSNAHWSSDVFFGAAIGYFTSKALLSFHKEEENRIIITPQLTKDTVGVSVGYRF